MFDDLILKAENDSALLKIISQIDVSVPERTEGRTKEHTERYSIVHLLSSLIERDLLTYPLFLTKRERPDFLLEMNNKCIGIEHTEAISENEAHKDVLIEKMNDSNCHFIDHHKPEELKKTHKQIVDEIQGSELGDGWVDDLVEKEWAAVMYSFIERKEKSLLKVGYSTFDKNWLLIYDNWSLPEGNYDIATKTLSEIVCKNAALNNFERVFILTGNTVYELSHKSLKSYPIKKIV